ncbi:hypothetical protein HY571_01770 [Candidatus Micrarchaeota archaeon]|nr:hypothetical protein [Candidatus Micrarchaeota archaeon]
MSLRFLRELQRHSTPDEFVTNFLVPALASQELSPLSPGESFSIARDPRAIPVSAIFFEHGGKRIPLGICRTKRDWAKTESTGRGAVPHVELGNFSKLFLDPEEFDTLETALGTTRFKHPGKLGSDSYVLNIPPGLVRHWRGRITTTSRAGHKQNVFLIALSQESFDALNRSMDVDRFTKRFLEILDVYRGVKDREQLKLRLKLMPHESRASDPVQAFFETHSSEVGILHKLPLAQSEGHVRSILAKRFGNTPRVGHYARIINGIFFHGRGRSAAQRISQAALQYQRSLTP